MMLSVCLKCHNIRVLSGPKILGGETGGRAGVIIVKQELCVFNCLINKNFMITFLGGNRTSSTPCWPLCR